MEARQCSIEVVKGWESVIGCRRSRRCARCGKRRQVGWQDGGSLCSCRNGLALGSMGHGLSASGPIPGCGSPNPLPPALPVPRTHPGTRSSRSYLVGGCRLLLTQTVRLR